MATKVSVVVPVYNVEEYLEKCLDSIVGQTLREINIICVDDGSTDGSSNILRNYAEKDKRITVISKKNGGLSSARNAGLKKCNTEYVMFCDSDDYIAPTMCEKMLSVIKKDDSDLAVCTQNVIYLTHDEMKRSDRSYYSSLVYQGNGDGEMMDYIRVVNRYVKEPDLFFLFHDGSYFEPMSVSGLYCRVLPQATGQGFVVDGDTCYNDVCETTGHIGRTVLDVWRRMYL